MVRYGGRRAVDSASHFSIGMWARSKHSTPRFTPFRPVPFLFPTHTHTHTCAPHSPVCKAYAQGKLQVTHTRTHARARAHTHTHTRTHARTHARTRARTHTHTRLQAECAPFIDAASLPHVLALGESLRGHACMHRSARRPTRTRVCPVAPVCFRGRAHPKVRRGYQGRTRLGGQSCTAGARARVRLSQSASRQSPRRGAFAFPGVLSESESETLRAHTPSSRGGG
jgi:hypothetical protein